MPKNATASAQAARLSLAEFREQAATFMGTIATRATTPKQRANRLRAYHGLGALVHLLIPARARYDKAEFIMLAETLGRGARWLYPLYQFNTLYDQPQLAELCGQADCISWTHVIYLLGLSSSDRAKYQRMIVRNKLTPKQFHRVLMTKHRKRQVSGRPLKIPDNPADAVEELVADGHRWLRRCDAVTGKLQSSRSVKDRANLKSQAKGAAATLQRIAKGARAAAQELGSLAARRKK